MDQYPGLNYVIAATIIALVAVNLFPPISELAKKIYCGFIVRKFVPNSYQSIIRHRKKSLMVYDRYMHTFVVYQYFNKTWNKVASAFHEREIEGFMR